MVQNSAYVLFPKALLPFKAPECCQVWLFLNMQWLLSRNSQGQRPYICFCYKHSMHPMIIFPPGNVWLKRRFCGDHPYILCGVSA